MLKSCSEFKGFLSNEDAWNQFSRFGLSQATVEKHKVVKCKKCDRFHILLRKDYLEGTEESDVSVPGM